MLRRNLGLLSMVAMVMLPTLTWLLHPGRPAPAAGPAAYTEIIVNGGFEQGSSGWEVSGNGPYALIGTAFPRTGNYGAILGARDNADDLRAQIVTVPAEHSATLTFWWYIQTEETGAEV